MRPAGFDPQLTQTVADAEPALRAGSSSMESPTRRRLIFAFWLTYWLAIVLCLAKLASLGHPRSTAAAHWDFAKDFAVSTHRDLLFALSVGLIGHLLIWITGRWGRLQAVVTTLFALFCTACVVYSIIGVRIFAYLKTPLTYPLLYVAGDFNNMRSSLGVFVTFQFMSVLVLGTIGYLVLSWQTQKRVGLPRGATVPVALAVAAALMTWQGVYAHRMYVRDWQNRTAHRLFDNPQWTLATSCLQEWGGRGSIRLRTQYPTIYWDDFDPQRAARDAAAARELALSHPATAPTTTPAIVIAPPVVSSPVILPARRPRNVVLLVLESTAAQHMSLYGSQFKTTPNLEAEAAHALVFDNFYAHVGMTASSLVAITLSNYPGITFRQYTLERPDMPGVSLADVLKERGYRTAFITSADIDFSGQDKFLAGRGFDRISDWRTLPGPKLFSWGSSDSALVDTMLQWIDKRDDQPFMLVGWTTQTHHPYQMSPGAAEIPFAHGQLPTEGEGLNLYLNCMHEDDEQIERFLNGLRQRGLADDTLVVITGDHGEAFRWPHDTSGHGFACYQECLNVPLMIWNPRLFPTGSRLHTIGGHVDINPTIADILGVPMPDAWQGRSMLDPARPPRVYSFAASGDYLLALREGNFKYIYNATQGADELYDLSKDAQEQQNLATKDPARCQQLRQRVAAWLEYEQQRQTAPSTMPLAKE